MVIFAVHNLIVDPPFSGLNLITCRNLLIYFQHSTQKKVLASLHFAMVKDGYLMLGSSETLGDLLPHFNVIAERERLYQKKTNLKLPLGTSPNVNLKHQTIPQVSELMRNYKSSDNNSSGVVIANEHIISMYAPPCVLLNEDLCVVHVYGDMSLFVKRLPPGRVTNQINDMVNDDISLAVSSALHKSKASQSLIEYVDMKTASDNDQYVSFNLRASYCSDNLNAKSNGYYWLIFDTQEYQRQDDNLISKSFDMSEQTQQRIEELELELKQSKESLQLTVEELEATNEELQSSNEELMSANEELQSTNEELQSVNEELFTVNSEYQEKISDFYEANTDLDEVLQLSRIGIIFLDTNMCIRRFTSAVTNYLNLLDTDLGRPFHHISLTIPYDDILKDIAEVLALKQMQEKEIILADKRALLVSIIPYMSSEDDVNTGVALTFSDVSALKYSELGVNVAYSTLRKSISNILAELDQTQPPTSIHALIVGKHNSRIKLLKDALMQNASIKFEVMHCDSTSEAKAIANKGKIDICFCDIECEEESIYSFVDSLNDLNRPIPLVAITDKESKGIEAVLISHGVLDLLSIDDVSQQSISEYIHQTIRRHHIDMQALTIN
jgi:two-component system CheB/CheR fusion protein